MAAKKKAQPASEEHVGTVEHYYPKAKAAAVKLDADLKLGDTIHIKGHSDDYTEKVTSIQLDHKPIEEGHAGESVGVAVPVKVHEHSEVTKIVTSAAAKAPAGEPRKAAKAVKKAKAPKAAKRSAKRSPAKRTGGARKATRTAGLRGKAAKRGAKRAGASRKAATGARRGKATKARAAGRRRGGGARKR